MLEYRARSDNDFGVICGVIALPHGYKYSIPTPLGQILYENATR